MKTTTTRVEASLAHPGRVVLRAKDVTDAGFAAGIDVVVITREDFLALTTIATRACEGWGDSDAAAEIGRAVQRVGAGGP